MTDKIRIVGSFGDGSVGKVQEFVKGLAGVESVSVLHDGNETYPDADSVKAEQAEGEGEGEAASTEPAVAPDDSLSKA